MKESIKDTLTKIVETNDEIYSVVAVVDSVDESIRTIDVTPKNGTASIYDVRLGANIGTESGVYMIPKVGSNVVVTFLNQQTAYCSAVGEVEKYVFDCDDIVFNGGQNDGLVIVGALVDRLNNIENKFNSLVSKFNAHTHVTTATVGASLTTFGVITPTTAQSTDTIAPITAKSDIENEKFKH